MNDPLDVTHTDALRARRWINAWFDDAKRRASTWEPEPCPLREASTHHQAHLEVAPDVHPAQPSTPVDPLLRQRQRRSLRRQR